MISVLIPIYNFDIRPLVAELYEELTELNVPFEIRCYDDGSYFDFKMNNQRVAAYPYVVYQELPENIGRSKIRNQLGRDAQHPYLLFLDCDSQCAKTNFIQTYLNHKEENTVLCGGTSYAAETPHNVNLILHWAYGVQREMTPLQKRVKKPYKSFKSNNFFIPKSVFLSILFDESIIGYGHEDTLFGVELKSRNIKVVQIDNPVHHLGLKSTHHFLESAHHAVQSLATLMTQGKIDSSVKLVKAYKSLTMLGLKHQVKKRLVRKRNYYINQLHSNHPDLKKLDKLKLLWLMEELENKEAKNAG